MNGKVKTNIFPKNFLTSFFTSDKNVSALGWGAGVTMWDGGRDRECSIQVEEISFTVHLRPLRGHFAVPRHLRDGK